MSKIERLVIPTDQLKPFKGAITNVTFLPCKKDDGSPGVYATCTFLEHPMFGGSSGHTSWIESYDPETGELETRNSRYKVV